MDRKPYPTDPSDALHGMAREAKGKKTPMASILVAKGGLEPPT